MITAAAAMIEVHGAAQRRSPVAGGLFHIGGLAVDQQGAEAGMVHIRFLSSIAVG